MDNLGVGYPFKMEKGVLYSKVADTTEYLPYWKFTDVEMVMQTRKFYKPHSDEIIFDLDEFVKDGEFLQHVFAITYEWPRKKPVDYIREWVMRRVVNDGECNGGVLALAIFPVIATEGDYKLTVYKQRSLNRYRVSATTQISGPFKYDTAYSDPFTFHELRDPMIMWRMINQACLRCARRAALCG